EIGARAPGFQRELAKLEFLFVKRKLNSLALIGVHGFAPHFTFIIVKIYGQKKGDSLVALKSIL
ncbi:hypothetical protein XU19_23780, partial [Vibrio parahaemolyticus]